MASTTQVENNRIHALQGPAIVTWVTSHYTRQELYKLFLLCAFPQHAWTLILAFRDISWVTARTNGWDAVGVVSYGLVFAFIESALLFCLMLMLGFLVSRRWDVGHRVALLSLLALILSLWAILEQLFFLTGAGLPGWFIDLLLRSGHPLRTLYILLAGLVSLTLLLPAQMILRSTRGYAATRELMERVSLLTIFYLFLDAIGLVVVIVRNLLPR